MNELDVWKTYLVNWFNTAPLLKFNYIANLAILTLFTAYFLSSLNMIDKLFTFIISGKVIGTDYVLKLSDVYIISAVILGSLLGKVIYNYLRSERNRNKIKLRIKEAGPLTLSVRTAA